MHVKVPKPELEEVILRGLQLRLSKLSIFYHFHASFQSLSLLSVSAWNTFYQITIWSLVYIFTVLQGDLTKNMRQLQGGFAPMTPWPGLRPWTSLGDMPPNPHIASHYHARRNDSGQTFFTFTTTTKPWGGGAESIISPPPNIYFK